ncbi:hypothetical protein [Calidifontibacillus erzurumensis]|uniref:Uncharacterized protein n=1 Tax=Calidifontibacillus erzurumensis TaxID=2741433 RepID=A0A8J8GGT5_9BACI|nr:hypothetical protein [Calidifontibacillus erzurumensis]NSL51523.1 hypothetical protein [Calidifontibacillus erzurumensis]
MEYWRLIENPTGKTYQQFIKVLCDHSNKFYFVTRKEFTYNKKVLDQFQPYVIETYKTKKWANTITKGSPATVYVIRANKETCKLLQQLSNSLYDWIAPNLPEDLTFIKDNVAWFTCTTHEKIGGFSISSDDYRNLISKIQGLKVEKEQH